MREILAHVQFRGSIRERSVEPFLRLFAGLAQRSRVRGVLFDISSGGGGSIPSLDLFLALKRLDRVKPVVASIGSVGASGGYLAALGARRIYAYPDSAVGSIGVLLPHFAVRELLRRLGIEVELLHAGRHKDAFQGFRPPSAEEREKLQALVDENYESFVALVARERHKPVDAIRALATGEVFSGRSSLASGLIDALGDRESALDELARITGVARHRVVRVTPPKPFLERLLGPGLQSVAETAVDRAWQGLDDRLGSGPFELLR